uniref:Uncharacterized protein n=1 Tax=Sphingobacterium sp. (strain 21) TaxID=743722 RepID=F4C870_SPHS2
MISFIVFTVFLFAVLWGWLALEYRKAILLTVEEEMELEHWMTAPEKEAQSDTRHYKVLKTGLGATND